MSDVQMHLRGTSSTYEGVHSTTVLKFEVSWAIDNAALDTVGAVTTALIHGL
jgi:hypothetical protein